MGCPPPESLVDLIQRTITDLLTQNPAATESEAYLLHTLEFAILVEPIEPRYFVRIGINYHGQKVQQLQIDTSGKLIGWNPDGDALGTGRRAKVLLSGVTIFERDLDEPIMNDSKIGGGDIPTGHYVRLELKVRGWLGKTKNLDGKQLEKDLELLKNDQADLLVICLSETCHRKWRGEGPEHQAHRRTGCQRFREILLELDTMREAMVRRTINFEEQQWNVLTKRVIGGQNSCMPGAEHYITLCWR